MDITSSTTFSVKFLLLTVLLGHTYFIISPVIHSLDILFQLRRTVFVLMLSA